MELKEFGHYGRPSEWKHPYELLRTHTTKKTNGVDPTKLFVSLTQRQQAQ